MGDTAAAGGVFMGLGLRGVRGSGEAEAVGVTEAPLEGGPKERHIQLGLDDVVKCVLVHLYGQMLAFKPKSWFTMTKIILLV